MFPDFSGNLSVHSNKEPFYPEPHKIKTAREGQNRATLFGCLSGFVSSVPFLRDCFSFLSSTRPSQPYGATISRQALSVDGSRKCNIGSIASTMTINKNGSGHLFIDEVGSGVIFNINDSGSIIIEHKVGENTKFNINKQGCIGFYGEVAESVKFTIAQSTTLFFLTMPPENVLKNIELQGGILRVHVGTTHNLTKKLEWYELVQAINYSIKSAVVERKRDYSSRFKEKY